MIRGSDGYEYEDLTARLVGRQADTVWNRDLRACHDGPCPEDEAHAYIETYGSEYRCLAPCHGHTAAHNTALEAARGAAKHVRREYLSRVRAYLYTATATATATAATATATATAPASPHPPAAGPAGAGGAHPGQAPTHPVHPAP